MDEKIELLDEVVDVVSGFRGIVTARAEYVTGCRQFLITPGQWDGGRYPEGYWLDEDRLRIEKKAARSMPTAETHPRPLQATGGPQPTPPRG